MQTIRIPLAFQPDLAAQLRREYALLSEALEQNGTLADEHLHRLRSILTDALEKQPALPGGSLHALRDKSPHHLLHLTPLSEGGQGGDALLDLPWHIVAERNPHLLVSKGLPVPLGEEQAPDLPLPLKVLVMVAAPDTPLEGGMGVSRLRYEDEEKVILDALAPLMRSGEVEVDFTDDGSLESLRRSLADHRYHVLHFSGHGTFGARLPTDTPEATLLLEDEFSMSARPTSAADFAAVLSADPLRMPALVLLSSCQSGQSQSRELGSGQGGKDGGFRGAAQRLMQAGVPAVIAMGWSVADFWATHFAGAFFKALAERRTLGEAFQHALAEGRKRFLPQYHPNVFLAQSLIPQLFLTRQVTQVVRWQGAAEKCLSRAGAGMLAGKDRLAAKLKKVHALFGRIDQDREWLFIGRRRERKAALAALRDGRSVLLRGQGGMGKTALALHLAQRRLVADPDGCVPFAFDQTSLSLENLNNALLDYLEVDAKQRTMRSKVAAVEKLWDKFFLLLENVEQQGVKPLFLLDNLESFQPTGGGALEPNALELLDYLLTRLGYPVICTGRYPLQEFDADTLHPLELHVTPFGDFHQKCLHLPALCLLEVPGRSFHDIVQTLHRSLGGNYRALEFFDELCEKAPKASAPKTLDALDNLIAQRTGETLQHIAGNLVFGQLLALLTPPERNALGLLAQFNRPVLPFALEWQAADLGDAEPLCTRIADLTLAERRTGEAEGRTYFFVPPLVRELLADGDKGLLNLGGLVNLALDDVQAGAYFEKMDNDLNKKNYADLEEAFFHYERAGVVEKLNAIGDTLSNFYYGASQFQRSFGFARRTEALAGEQTDGRVLNLLGLLFQLYGKLEAALHFLEKSLADYRRRGDRQGEGVTLNNISQIHQAKGDYDTALGYLQQSLKIRQEIGDRKGEGATLNNLATTAHAKGDYDTALGYLQQSLKITQEIGDRKGEGTTLNNISQIHKAKGDYDTALGYLQQSLKIRQEIGDRQGEGTTLNNISQIHQAKGDYDTALGYLQQSLKIRQEIGDRQGEGTTLNNISQIHQAKGDYDTALGYLQQSLKIRQEIGDRQGEGTTLNNISQIHDAKGDYDTALGYLQQSLKIRQEIGDRKGESTTIGNIASIYHAKGEYDKAIEFFQKDLKICQDIGDRQGEGTTLNNISQIHQAKGDYDTALGYLQQSLKIRQDIGDISGMATTLTNMGSMLFERDQAEEAVLPLVQAYQIFERIGSPNAKAVESWLNAIIKKIGQARFEEILRGGG